jgi:hypothetical protein
MLNVDIIAEINGAIQQAATEAGQDEGLSNKIIAWFNALSNGNESLEDHTAIRNHMELMMKHVHVDIDEEHSDAD